MHARVEVSFDSGPFDWERRPVRTEDLRITAPTRNWLIALPKGVRPLYLQLQFPRIANELERLWDMPAALDRYFLEKEHSPRSGRAGFPALVQEELLVLHVYSLRTRFLPAEDPPDIVPMPVRHLDGVFHAPRHTSHTRHYRR